jgi:hypothetical protein
VPSGRSCDYSKEKILGENETVSESGHDCSGAVIHANVERERGTVSGSENLIGTAIFPPGGGTPAGVRGFGDRPAAIQSTPR